MFLSCLKDAPEVSCVCLPLSSRCWGPASWQGLTLRCWELWVVGLPMVAQSCASSVRLAGLSRWQWPGSHSMGWEISYTNYNKLKFSVCVTHKVKLFSDSCMSRHSSYNFWWIYILWIFTIIIHIAIMHFYLWSMLYTSIESPNIKIKL